MAKARAGRAKAGEGILSGELRRILSASEGSFYSIEEEAGVPHGALSRFMAGKRGLSLETLDRLARAMGLRLAVVEKRVGNRRRRAGVAVPS